MYSWLRNLYSFSKIKKITSKINARVAESVQALTLLKTASEKNIAAVLNNDSLFISRVCGENAGEVKIHDDLVKCEISF